MKTVITYGVFDLFHEGHVNLLKRAKELGDRLIVGVTSNEFTRQRGKLLLADSLDTRMENVRRCEYVDEVILEDHFGQKLEDVQKYHADVFVIGSDWEGRFDYLKKYCEVVYLPRTPGISSSSLRHAPYPSIRFGIIGNGRIVTRFIEEASFVRNGVLVSKIYNPHRASAETFCEKYEHISAAATLEELFQSCDVIYVASPHSTHSDYVRKALHAGKHVLCEKPLCFSKQEATELYDYAKEHSLILMEAIKTAYTPGFNRVISIVQSGFIGEVHDVESCFTKLVPVGSREWNDCGYGGSFTELGSYVLLPIIRLLGTDDLQIRFNSLFNEEGNDFFTKISVSNGKMLSLGKTGLGTKSSGELIISGSKGYLTVPAPWWKTSSFEIHHEDPYQVDHYYVEFLGEGLRYEIAEMVDRIQGWHRSDYMLTVQESVCMAGIFEKFLDYRQKQTNL